METVDLPTGLFDAVSAATTERALVQAVADWLPQTLCVTRAGLARAQPDGLRVVSFSGGRLFRNGLTLPLDASVSGQVLRDRRAMALADMAQSENPIHAQLAGTGFRSLMVAPLITGDRCLGTVHAMHTEPDVFDDGALTQLAMIALLVAARLDAVEQGEEVRRLGMIDPQTGALNRRAFMEAGADAHWLFQDGDLALSLVVFNIDHFKGINDTYGHAGGDAVLANLVAALRTGLRRGDSIAHLGGAEFAILMPDAPLHAALGLAERIRDTVDQLEVSSGTETIRVTVSLGVAEATPDDDCIEALLSRADAALFAAKKAGCNQVMTAA